MNTANNNNNNNIFKNTKNLITLLNIIFNKYIYIYITKYLNISKYLI